MRDAPIVRASPFFSYWRHTDYRCISHVIAKGEELFVAHLALMRMRDALHTNTSPFQYLIKHGIDI
jgi:hypothetical protein